MKRLVLALMSLSLITIGAVVFAQGPEMMDSGMMGGPSMMESEQSKEMQTQNTSAGAEIFNANCKVCHVNGGNVINPAMPFNGSTKLADFETFLSYVRNPKLPDGSRGSMPSFSDSQISDKQAKELYQFITSSESNLMGGSQGRWSCPRYAQCATNQQRYHMGPGMMGTGQQGWNYCPYCGQSLGQRGYGMMGSGMMGMMGGYGMGPGMHGGYGMGPGMMRGPGMMGPGYYGQGVDCQNFFDETADLRKDFHNKKFEYMETIRNPKANPESITKLQNELNEIRGKVLSKAPQGCFVQ